MKWTDEDEINFIWSIRAEDILLLYAKGMSQRYNWNGMNIDRIRGTMLERLVEVLEKRKHNDWTVK